MKKNKLTENNFSGQILLDCITPTMATIYRIKKVIYRKKTKYHKIEIVETYDRGICFVLNNQIQSSLNDEWIYHETLVHPIMITHPRPSKVLVIGGGEGGTIREVLKHNIVKKIKMVEISKDVVDVAKKYLKEIHQGSFYNSKVEVIFNDGRNYLIEESDKFDCIIIDATDPSPCGISAGLYTKEFYEIVKRKLEKNGIFVTQATSPFYNSHTFSSIYATVSNVFPIVRGYSFGAGFVAGSKKFDPLLLSKKEIKKRIKKRMITNLKFYNENIHKLLFIIPEYSKINIKSSGKVMTDNEMLSSKYSINKCRN
ncbi:MAG: polyamine aminopropyltransferase [Candidatus Aenigmatarchaeota archaeon]